LRSPQQYRRELLRGHLAYWQMRLWRRLQLLREIKLLEPPSAAAAGGCYRKRLRLEALLVYCIVCPLLFLAGFVDAVAGGGGLISLPAYLIAGLPIHTAIGTNKFSMGMGTAVATYRFAKSGYIHWKLAFFCAVCALVGSAVGAELALMIDDSVFKIVMLVILPATGLYVLFGKGLNRTGETDSLSPRKTLLLGMVIALVIGMYDGFYGPGTGTFLLLLLTGVAHMKLSDANGLTKVINLTTNVTAVVVYLSNGKVCFPLALIAGCFSIAGNYIGTRFFASRGIKAVKPIILLVLAIFFVKVFCEVIG
jgi:uncharacterized membrane protein YfcA